MSEVSKPHSELLARRFHEAYERLAPAYGYTTRPDSAVPWENVPLLNKRLMVATVEEACADIFEQLEATERERAEYRDVLERIVRRHQYREPHELPTLAFTMKEDALEVLASYPAMRSDDA